MCGWRVCGWRVCALRACGLRVWGLRVRGLWAQALEERFGVAVRLSWGMTELSPCGVVGSLTRGLRARPYRDTLPWRLKPGRAMYARRCVCSESPPPSCFVTRPSSIYPRLSICLE